MYSIREVITKMPKVELHVHLEGSVQPKTLLKLAEQNKVELPSSDVDGLKSWYQFEDFGKFVEIYMKICECIRTSDDVFTVAWEFFQEQKRQNIIYSEITWTAYTHLVQYGLSFDEQAEALFAAADRAEKELGVRGLYVFDIPRQVGAKEGLVTAQWLVKHRNPDYIAAIGLGGPEVGFPPELYADAFTLTGAVNIPAVPHAGETGGPKSIRGALKLPGTVRIGHGVRAVEDSALVGELVEKGIVLEVCPTSNIRLNVFPDMKSHSLPKLIESGVKVTINSDDPPMFSTDLTGEYQEITEVFGFNIQRLKKFNETAIDAALCNENVRVDIKDVFTSAWKKLGTPTKK
jgi:adenosine deaminase